MGNLKFSAGLPALTLLLTAPPLMAADTDTISVTASRIERPTKEVASSITVIDEQKIEDSKMMNIKDAIQGTPGVLIDSKNGGYDVRLIIRGAGQKANYGVREIMVLRDGVPMTDPDSFSRFDFIDTQDIERIEITKGPGSLYGSGSAGGTIQIISKSVFDTESNRIKAGIGEQGGRMLHARIGGHINDSNAISLTASHRETESEWRDWNKFDTQQISLKHGLLLGDTGTLESELSYSQANIQLPASMDAAEFEVFKRTGEQHETTSSPWQNSGRYSKIWFFNSRLEQEFGDLTFKPRIYFNRWSHYHPVTGLINDNPGTNVFGTDLEFSYNHQLLGNSTLVAGVTARMDQTQDAKKYSYADVTMAFTTIPFPHMAIAHTNSDEKGDLLEQEKANNTLYGLFMQETLRPSDKLTVDLGFRYDQMRFDIDNVAYGEYSWGTATYSWFGAPVITKTDTSFKLFSPKLGITYALTDLLNVYASIAQSGQVPAESEIQNNPDLTAATARNVEIGLKGRGENWTFDLAAYHTTVSDDIIQVYTGWTSNFENAGKTLKKGVEFSGRLRLGDRFWLGAGYAYSDYTFVEFIESALNDYSGNRLPYVPQQQYNLSLEYEHPSGFKARIQTDTWGEYWMDNANTEKYGGYEFLTSLMIGYEHGHHSLTLNVDNLFDQHYAVEAKKSSSGTVSYSAGAPRTAMLNYRYQF